MAHLEFVLALANHLRLAPRLGVDDLDELVELNRSIAINVVHAVGIEHAGVFLIRLRAQLFDDLRRSSLAQDTRLRRAAPLT